MSEITPNTPNPVREDAYKQQLAEKLGIDPQYIPGSPIWHSEEEIAAIAEMFSNMAGGSSGGGVLVVNMVDDYTDKTWKEIYDAPMAVIVQEASGATAKRISLVETVAKNGSVYGAVYYDRSISDLATLVTDSENGYLTWAE